VTDENDNDIDTDDGDDDDLDADQWANTVGDDDELDRLWLALMEATGAAEPKAMEETLARHLAGLGARSRRTTEGLILAATAATATEGSGWEDWRVILHRHFIRDERMNIAVAAAILLELRKAGAKPDWHSTPERVMDRVIGSVISDMRAEIDTIDQGPQTAAGSATLATLASELFDVAIALTGPQAEEVRNSAQVAEQLGELLRLLGERAARDARPAVTNLVKAHALVEVTIRQLELAAPILH
jgi:hypothetical protein